jgi:hypothetical protein
LERGSAIAQFPRRRALRRGIILLLLENFHAVGKA